MNLYYNNQKIGSIKVLPNNTVGQIKIKLNNWLVTQGIVQGYDVRLFFNNGTELSLVVFTTNTYDKINFQTQAKLLQGGSISVTSLMVLPETKGITHEFNVSPHDGEIIITRDKDHTGELQYRIRINFGRREVRGTVEINWFSKKLTANVSTLSWAETDPEIGKKMGYAYVDLSRILIMIRDFSKFIS